MSLDLIAVQSATFASLALAVFLRKGDARTIVVAGDSIVTWRSADTTRHKTPHERTILSPNFTKPSDRSIVG